LPISVQLRDLQILKFVYACRVATYNQIARRFFKGKHYSLVTRCLRRHRESNYLNAYSMRIGKTIVQYVEITPKGFNLIKESWPFEIDNPLFKSDSPMHDIHLNEILLKFEVLKSFKAFYTENLLQSSTALKTDLPIRDLSKLYSDGALLLNGPDGLPYVYGVEFEQSKKAPERYREKFQAYYRAEGIDGILYVVTDQEIANSIAKEDLAVCDESKSLLYLSSLESVLSSNKQIYFKNNKSEGIELF
jgi:hypothetical protein